MFRQNGRFFFGGGRKGTTFTHLEDAGIIMLAELSCQCQSGWNFELQSTKRSHISRIHVFLLDLGLGLCEVEIHFEEKYVVWCILIEDYTVQLCKDHIQSL